MTSDDDARPRAVALRDAAVARVRARTRGAGGTALDHGDALRVLHELEVHQIELELQAEELAHARDDAEAALVKARDLYENAPVAYVTVAPDGGILQVNAAAARLTGLPRDAVLGRGLASLFAPRDRQAVDQAFAAARAGASAYACEVELVREPPVGAARIVQLGLARAPAGDEVRAVAIDVTAQRHAERRLHEMEKMAALGRLSAGVAHDFNNLLAVIALQLDLAMEDGARASGMSSESRAASASLSVAKEAAERAKGLTRQLLALGRGQPSRKAIIDLNAFVTSIVRMLAQVLDARIEVDCALTPAAPQVSMDPSRLDQLLVNLVLNARDALPDGGRITIATHASESARLTVTDTGMGMSASTRARIFEPFFSLKRDAGGTGLGLATVWSIADEAGGSVLVDSEEGQGTTMTVILPLAPHVDSDAPVPRETTRRSPRRTETVLVVDDVPAVLDVVSRALTALGCTVLRARGGHEALEVEARHEGPIHLVITDVHMPGMTGGSLAASLRARRPALRVILMSGHIGDETGRAGEDAQTTLLAKPFALEELSAAVRAALDASVEPAPPTD